MEYFTREQFHNIIDDHDQPEKASVSQVILCTGKVYYDLLEERRTGHTDIAIIRTRAIVSVPADRIPRHDRQLPQCRDIVWCQEEPQNQGAWDMIKHRFSRLHNSGREIYYVGRESAAAPATGFHRVHEEEQEKLVDDALSGRFDKR